MTTLIILGTSLFICLLLFVIDERRRRNTIRTEASKWMNPRTKKEEEIYKEYPYQQELGFQLIFKKLPNTKFRGKLLIGKLGAPLVFFVVIPWLLLFFASIADGTLSLWFSSQSQLYILLTTALMFYLFRSIIDNVPRGFKSIGNANDQSKKSKTFVRSQLKEKAQYLTRTSDLEIINKSLMIDISIFVVLVTLVFIVIVTCYFYIPDTKWYLWYASPDYFWGHLVYFSYYILLICYFARIALGYVARLIISMQSVGKKLYNAKIVQIPLVHPDQAGGLGQFGKLAWRIDLFLIPFLIAPFGWFAIVRIVNPESEAVNPLVITCVIIGILLIPIFFFIPLVGVNRAMKEAKRLELIRLSNESQIHYRTMTDAIDKKKRTSDDAVQYAYNELQRIVMMYDRAEKMPVWPFDRNTIEKVSLTVIIPLVLFIMQLMLD